ncbi:putative addiction module component, TIGR02574 family [Verrucomicrobiia bacterium DG1235]|nr:putative addiction module component, TIGR02574 family [Verrucomicrobiae bacterium DG1235]
MTRIEALKIEAMDLTDSDRATLASELLYSLPATLSDEDEGMAEALRRDADLTANPSSGMTWDELKKGIGRD